MDAGTRAWLASSLGLLALLAACGRSPPDTAPHTPALVEKLPEASNERRDAMIDRHLRARGIEDEAVLAAMRRVPREQFVLPEWKSRAYDDSALPIAAGQTISQPYIVALMTEALALDNTSRVLEVGTGSGYQAAVLAEITPHVYTIEIVEELARHAEQTLRAQGYDKVNCRLGDGYAGWPEQAPFDAIIVTAAPPSIPAPLIEQLAPGGRLVLPVGPEGNVQDLLLVTKDADGQTETRHLAPVRFVPMTGEAQAER